MDPDQLLNDIRDLARQLLAERDLDDPAYQLADKVLNLDGWLISHGFTPNDWRH